MNAPPCRSLGRQCHVLDVTVRIAALEGDEDHDATWTLGHTERIEFGPLFEEDGELWSKASIHVPCRHLSTEENGSSVCRAHGYAGRTRAPKYEVTPCQIGGDRFVLVENGRSVARTLPSPVPATSRPLPLAAIPCAVARCRTSDNKVGSACCRDLQLEIRCSERQRTLHSLIRARKAPYLCKVAPEPDEDGLVNVEIISACGYLDENGLCALHGRTRADGRPAKPTMCSTWPEKRTGLHPGCAFRNTRLPL